MALSPTTKAGLARFTGRRLARYIKLVFRTSRLVTEPADIDAFGREHAPCIVAMWHGQFLMIPCIDLIYTGPVAAMVARHGDAELIGEAIREFGTELIRGAGAGTRQKDRGGAQALRAAVKALNEGRVLCMTADVPPGPARVAGLGIVTLARVSGRPIMPLAAATSRYRALNTWSRMTINLPFSRLVYVAGTPIPVPRDADEATLEAKRREVEAALNAVTRRAYELAGADMARATPPAPASPDDPPAAARTQLKLYRAATSLLPAAAPILLTVRERQGKEDPLRRSERLGRPTMARPLGTLVWAHAASVGETNAVLPVIDAMSAARPDLRFLLTTGTVTSAGLAAQRLKDNALHQYVPLDAPRFIERFLAHWQPDLAILVESEIWPNTILALHERRIPLALVNARMSPRSFRRWSRRPGLAQPIFNRFDLVLTQSEVLMRRFKELGARRVLTAGNLKIDSPPPPVDATALDRLKVALAGRPLWLAASTHPGEETIVAEAHRLLAARLPGVCTLLAPRHPERGSQIAEDLRARGLKVELRSSGALPGAETDVYLCDTIGELGTLYALSPIAFIGGSLVPHGGQNPIEAVRHGAAVLAGPNIANFQDIHRALLRRKGTVEVQDAGTLAAAVERLSGDAAERARQNADATAAIDGLAGALTRTVEALLDLIDRRPPRGAGEARTAVDVASAEEPPHAA